MQEKKISINIFYNILNQIVSFIVPLILSPYVARVLNLLENIHMLWQIVPILF